MTYADGTVRTEHKGQMTPAYAGHNAPHTASDDAKAGTSLSSAELYDPGTGAFAPTGAMTHARRQHASSAFAAGKILVVSGGVPAEIYDVASGMFSVTDALVNDNRSNPTATALASGKVLVLGFLSATAELYDPMTGQFSLTGPPTQNRDRHTATLLESGKVLVVGGDNPPVPGAYASTELFDPKTGSFTALPSLALGRTHHTATLLPGAVLIVGGDTKGNGTAASAELLPLASLGAICALGDDCVSGSCVDGRCCNSACANACDRCNVAGKLGTCSVSPAGEPGVPSCAPFACDGASATCPSSCSSDVSCASTHYCAADGSCQPRKAQGASCPVECKTAGTCRACATGFCTDGVCCDAACTGQCDACDVAAGVCGPVSGAPHAARPPCATGLVCSAGACVDVKAKGARCDGDHIATDANDVSVDCAPFKCESNGTCRATCSSVADCVTPAVCSGEGRCAVPAASNDDGCHVSPPSEMPWWLLGVLVLARRRLRGVT